MNTKTTSVSNMYDRCRLRHCQLFLSALCLSLAAMGSVQAQTPNLEANYDTYFTDEDISISFANGPGNPKDWIGVYPEGVEPGPTPSTLWLYVDNTKSGTTGLKEGTVTFTGGLTAPGTWYAYLLENDGYTKLATNTFTVLDPYSPRIRSDKRTYSPNQAITLTFNNAPGNPKDWIGIYMEGQTPGGGPASTAWTYLDGTQSGDTAVLEGSITFSTGLSQVGKYVAYLMVNDGYEIIASNVISVAESASLTPRILSLTPANNSSNLPPVVPYMAAITNGTSKVLTNSVSLTIDGNPVTCHVDQETDLVTVTYTNQTLYAPGSTHTARLFFTDNATPINRFTNEIAFSVIQYRNIVLPAPLYFEDFDSTPEGQLPTGWTQTNYTEVLNPDFDLGNLDSASYATWVVVNAERFTGTFITYSNPDAPLSQQEDYHRVLSINPNNVVNGAILNAPLATGRFLFSSSGYRYGRSQVEYVFTPDFNLSTKSNVYLSFHSLWEQNQDSVGAVEYSIDQGASWLPVVYMIDGRWVLTTTNETTGEINVDAVATFTTQYSDLAFYTDENGEEKGGTFGSFIGAAISQDLAPFISPRVDDDRVDSKRVELFRLTQADDKATVRFRIAHAGTDSWYFGIDDFGLYSIAPTPVNSPSLTIARSGANVVISWSADISGYTLESTTSITSTDWKTVAGVANNSVTIVPDSTPAFYRLRK